MNLLLIAILSLTIDYRCIDGKFEVYFVNPCK